MHACTTSLHHTHTDAPLEHPCAHWHHKPTSRIANKSISTYCMQTLPQTHHVWGDPSLHSLSSVCYAVPWPSSNGPYPTELALSLFLQAIMPSQKEGLGPNELPCFCGVLHSTPHSTGVHCFLPSLEGSPWQLKPWVLRPACLPASYSLTHPPSTQTAALFPESTSYPQPHRHRSPARHTYFMHPAQPQPCCPQTDSHRFSSLLCAVCVPLLSPFCIRPPVPEVLFPDTLSCPVSPLSSGLCGESRNMGEHEGPRPQCPVSQEETFKGIAFRGQWLATRAPRPGCAGQPAGPLFRPRLLEPLFHL